MLTSSTPLLSLVLLALSYTTHADTDSKPLAPCNIISPRTGAQFDLSPMAVKPLPDGSFKKHDRNKSYHARGYDYGANFTMNFCAPVVENFTRVVGVDEGLWGNISAYYEREGRAFSLGQMSTQPVFRGRKLVMNYTGGSPCGADAEDEDNWYERRGVGERSQDEDDEDRDGSDEDDRSSRRKSKKPVQRKNAIFSFLCDQEPVDSSKPKVQVSFVSWSPDECTYVFEARSRHSCGGLAKQPKSVGAGGVFSLIAFIAIAVYVLGGIAYQRTVMHQRGWRQLPNYAIWAGIASFFRDMGIILFSSCARFMPQRRGYNQLPTGTSRGRGINREEENGLIDQLDEEWDD